MPETLGIPDLIADKRDDILRLASEYKAYNVRVFGSVARGEATPASDVDLLVELSRPLGFEFVTLADHIENILGRKVDLSTFGTLRRSLENPRYRAIALEIQRT